MPQKHQPGTTEGFLAKLREGGFKNSSAAKKSIGKMATWSAAEKKRGGQLADEYFADPAKFSVKEFYKAAPAAKSAAASRLDPPVLLGSPSASSPTPALGRSQALASLEFLERLVRVSNETLVGLAHVHQLYPEADISEGQVIVQAMSVAIGVVEKLTKYALLDLPSVPTKAEPPVKAEAPAPPPKNEPEPADEKSDKAPEEDDDDDDDDAPRPPWAKKK